MKTKRVFLVAAFIVFAILFALFSYFLNKDKVQPEYDISNNCELVKVFSYSGDIISCRDYKLDMPENAQNWCNQRFEEWKHNISEYKKYVDRDCKIVGMTSTSAKNGALGCSEFCDFICCE